MTGILQGLRPTTIGRRINEVRVSLTEKLLKVMRHETSITLTNATWIAVLMLFLSSLLAAVGTWKLYMLAMALGLGLLFF
jgi:hypothetical protein